MNYCMKSMIQIRNFSYGKLGTWYSGLVKRPPPIPPFEHITQIGDPVLRSPCEQIPDPVVNIKLPVTQFLISRLKFVLNRYDCVGLSAPQIGVPLRVVVVEFNDKHAARFSNEELKNKDMRIFPQAVVINPELKVIDFTKVVHWESCGSFTGYFADVPRFKAVEIKGFNDKGEAIAFNVSGWIARIFQHEIDHLNGNLYTDIMDRKTLTCSCWEAVNERRGKVELPFSY